MKNWVLALIEYSLTYIPHKAVKGQALADFLADHPSDGIGRQMIYVGIIPWRMMFDGSKTSNGEGAGVVLISPTRNVHQYAFQIEKDCSNNQAKYEALIIDIKILLDLSKITVQIFGDSLLVIKQLAREFKCNACSSIASQILKKFDDVTITYVPRLNNGNANVVAQLTSGLRILDGVSEQWVKVSKPLPLIDDRYKQVEMVNPIDLAQDDWRTPIIRFLQNPQSKVEKKINLQAVKLLKMVNIAVASTFVAKVDVSEARNKH
ncbi:hypothetical protein RJ640_021898 [Escallonia rubra]|uniref:RNase H type-1 domain-containing protein n=1 Tax=Escallonia rubra TaxID=112253 RepID=A0AA88RTX1_9ASTE|nr:hypothetical protein RJ640_021898 [Escallonia rubra]